jgi:uroporphyrinogen-III decarboxylase
MTDKQWKDLKDVINGKVLSPAPSGFIIDCPWIPGWYGVSVLDYFTNDEIWLKANLKAVNDFPEVIFFPGFWSEYGMCTEPSSFGAKCVFFENAFPHADKVINSVSDIHNLVIPNPATDGMLPFMLNRLKKAQPLIEATGHKIRFAVARGPLNIASYLMGATEFMMALMMEPEKAHLLLRKITDFLKSWIELQRKNFTSIDGIMLLDDIIGFISEEDFKTFGLPYLKEIYSENVSVKLLHNDASCEASLKYLPEIGVNVFNMAFDTNLNELKKITNNKVVMLGNIPPRDVLAAGSPADVEEAVKKLSASLESQSHLIYSCGGGMPMGVKTENLKAFSNGLKRSATF